MLILYFLECSIITNENTTCKFPFTYRDEEYYSCINENEDKPWCAVETNAHGKFIKTKHKWGYCRAECPGDFNSRFNYYI